VGISVVANARPEPQANGKTATIPTIATRPGTVTGIKCARLRQMRSVFRPVRGNRSVLLDTVAVLTIKECPVILARGNYCVELAQQVLTAARP